MQVHNGHGLGCWLASNDPRSRTYTTQLKVMETRRTVLHTANAPVLDQDGVGACVGFTCVDLVNTAKFVGSRRAGWGNSSYLANSQGFAFYREATRLDEWTDEAWEPDDTGSSVLAGAKALKRNGYIKRYEWAWDFDGFLAALQRQPVMLGTLWCESVTIGPATGGSSAMHTYLSVIWIG
jgi:hypothetical protein